jgi:hypothetical protein
MNEKNIGKCLLIGICSMMGNSTLIININIKKHALDDLFALNKT